MCGMCSDPAVYTGKDEQGIRVYTCTAHVSLIVSDRDKIVDMKVTEIRRGGVIYPFPPPGLGSASWSEGDCE